MDSVYFSYSYSLVRDYRVRSDDRHVGNYQQTYPHAVACCDGGLIWLNEAGLQLHPQLALSAIKPTTILRTKEM